MRINKYLSSIGVASRREIDRLVEKGSVRVNSAIATPGIKVSASDVIEINGKKIQKKTEKKVYFMLNKPAGVISAAKDDRGRKTVVDLIKCEERIYPVGRLDFDTEGLILLTSDGDFFNKIMHPKSEVYKEYHVDVMGKVNKLEMDKLKRGVRLEDGMTLPAKVEILDSSHETSKLRISIREGRNRQIRRMCKAIGHPVIHLKREKIGELSLGNLKKGGFRELSKKEVEYLYSL
ncbi:pseudouridine synthase [uncultured Ilyobacter sp.]|uniref:pseudouridine synthase n=1 Tax=uncultured Ilyobacter sp. TaxID=544433 RepID=UPI002AA6F649|nr:pseudouridine synthase [uncultured Ilyobacter sp.]